MPGWLTVHIIGLVLVAALFGGMLFFAALFTPLVFRKLPRETAAAFLRDVFPVYYRVMGIASLVAALPLGLAQGYKAEVALLVAVAAGFVIANTVIRPRVERAREDGRDARFKTLHRTSVVLNLGQFILVTIVLIRLAQ